MTTTSTFSHSVIARDFSAKTRRLLLKKGVRIAGAQAMPGFPGDKYYTKLEYQLVTKSGLSMLRSFHQVIVMGSSSWHPDDTTDDQWDD